MREINTESAKVKRTEQVGHMLMSLREAYNKFSESHASTNIGISKFCELKSKKVELFDHIHTSPCLCMFLA